MNKHILPNYSFKFCYWLVTDLYHVTDLLNINKALTWKADSALLEKNGVKKHKTRAKAYFSQLFYKTKREAARVALIIEQMPII